jgi:Domain of unknown function (DUF4268)
MWPTYHDWMRRSLETLRRVLGSRIAKPAPAPGPPRDPSTTGAFQVEYWAALRGQMIAGRSPLNPHMPLPQHWTNYAIGRTGFHLSATMLKTAKDIGVYLVLGGPDAKPQFRRLFAEKAVIAGEIGAGLEWRELPAGKESHVVLRRKGVDPDDRESWPDQHAWLENTLEAFHRAFAPRIRGLSGGEPGPAPSTP